MRTFKSMLCAMMMFAVMGSLSARENVEPNGSSEDEVVLGKGSGNCQSATSQTELNINNVRTRLLTGGDMWWDLNSAQYEVPKIEPGSGEVSRHSLFAGALWIGGVDALGQLKVAAQTYRQSGNDFYPGPLDQNGQVSEVTCSQFDQFWEVRGEDIDDFVSIIEESLAAGQDCPSLSESDVPLSILQWPARNNQYFEEFALPFDQDLAPFFDCNGDGEYDPLSGDYPVIDAEIEGVYADQMIWWVLNDRGNDHSETGGEAIGLEIGALAFAFATNDEVNNMTFYKYVIENNATTALDSVYFGQWVDPDLGEYTDDFVGCDTSNSLGIVYNGDAVDGPSEQAYPGDPPMLAVDFFQGPKDEEGNELGMSSFLYYDNNFEVTGNPETASHYYQYLAGFWKDGLPFTFGGNGYGGTEPVPFMFPSDPAASGTIADGVWSECSAGNEPFDRRFLQNSGPFLLQPGAVNDLIVGVVWVDQAGGCGSGASFDPILKADQKAQGLFDSNFKVVDGPDAPNLTIRELDRELVISLWNAPSSNNYREEFLSIDPILSTQQFPDSTFEFQGYEVYQLKRSSVSSAELGDNDVARPVAIVDIDGDGVTRLINYEFNAELDQFIPVVKVEGTDNGIRHTFNVTQDLFAEGSRDLVNNKPYYFMAIAYAANKHEPYNPNEPSQTAQKEPYLAGRKNIRTYTAIPHQIGAEAGGALLNSAYGDGPEITQISGYGNGGLELELTEESIQTILEDGFDPTPTYAGGSGPVDVKIFDPLLLQGGEYELRIERVNILNLPEETQKGGTLTYETDGTVTYNPPSGLTGYDSFTYEIVNEDCSIDKGTVRLDVNDPILVTKEAFDDSFYSYNFNHFVGIGSCTDLGGCPPVTLDVLANDVGGTSPTITAFSQPTAGTVELDGSVLKYRAERGKFGLFQFLYEMTAEGEVDTATVYMNVIDPRTGTDFDAVDDQVAVGGDGSSFNVLGNDLGENIGTDYMPGSSSWVLENLTTGKVYRSLRNIKKANEQAIGGWERDLGLWSRQDELDEEEQELFEEFFDPQGFSVSVTQVATAKVRNAVIRATVEFENVESQWIQSLADGDGNNTFEWIRSGNLKASGDPLETIPDYSNNLNDIVNPQFYDPRGWYETILDGTIAPYCLTNNVRGAAGIGAGSPQPQILTISPACSDCYGIDILSPYLYDAPPNNLDEMCSVDMVLTSNKDLWTRVPVVEMGRESANNFGGASKNNLRRSKSKDKDGNEEAGIGMSWFPGYAINLETGERLNIMFGENSFIGSQNGRDMLFNPTDLLTTPTSGADQPSSGFKMGGEHWVYVMSTRYSESRAEEYAAKLNAPAEESTTTKKSVYDDAMYVIPTVLTEGFETLSAADGIVPSDVKVKIRMAKPYYQDENGETPVYRFNMDQYAASVNNADIAASALDDIRVVPNPYYGFSEYENSKFDNTIKITNLPARGTVRIFSVDGTFIRELGIDNAGSINGTSLSTKNGTVENSLDWDLRNFKGVPIASGVYIINIEAPDIGESKTIKWFGVLREIDLDTF